MRNIQPRNTTFCTKTQNFEDETGFIGERVLNK